jgi:hypothetical protein
MNITVIYRVSIFKVEHRQLTLCIRFIDIMLLLLYINNNNTCYSILYNECEIDISKRVIHDIYPTTTKKQKNANIRHPFLVTSR